MSARSRRSASRALRQSCWYPLRSPPPTIVTSTASRNGPYSAARVLRRVGEDRHVVVTRRRRARTRIAADLAVHHPARRDDVGAGSGLGDGRLGVDVERGVVVDHAVLVEDAAVAVVGVLVDAQVGHQHDVVAEVGAQIAQGDLHDAVGVERPAADGVLVARARRTGSPTRTPRSASSATSSRSSRGCAGRRRAATRSAAVCRCPRARTAVRSGRRPADAISATSSRIATVRRSRRGRSVRRTSTRGRYPGGDSRSCTAVSLTARRRGRSEATFEFGQESRE